jgi:hypothetical protein
MPDEHPRDTRPSFWASLGLIASALSSELGRSVAVVGALVVGFSAYGRSANAGSNEWTLLTIAAATFCLLVWLCRK